MVGLVSFLLSNLLMNLLISLVSLFRALIWTMRLRMEPSKPGVGFLTIRGCCGSYFFLGLSYLTLGLLV